MVTFMAIHAFSADGLATRCGRKAAECTSTTHSQNVTCPECLQGTERPNVGILPDKAEDRKGIPLCTGVLDYFPAALAYLARVSKAGNDQHNPGQPLHWSRGKSTDHADCVVRHLVQRGTLDTDGFRHSGKVAWRALALLQEELEREEGAPLPRAAWTDDTGKDGKK